MLVRSGWLGRSASAKFVACPYRPNSAAAARPCWRSFTSASADPSRSLTSFLSLASGVRFGGKMRAAARLVVRVMRVLRMRLIPFG
jgi:hypothetical protein